MAAKSQVHSSMLVASLRDMFIQLSVDVLRHLCKLSIHLLFPILSFTPSIMYNMKHCIGVRTGGMDMLWNGIGIVYGNFMQS